MVFLNRIYTKTGDEGQTSLGDGTRVSKTHPRVVAYGSVDELNSILGLTLTESVPAEVSKVLLRVQNDLFDLGADLCVPEPETESTTPALRISESQVARLEQWIDSFVERLQALESFILPGGTRPAALLHHARTVCRRSEVEILRLAEFEDLNHFALKYINRLSDLLFVAARICNDCGRSDLLWIPGENREDSP